ncbi:MAG: GcvT family protein [Planctomycetota bacterium]|jgi:4-methylaminobutanoate oxidase (formaldehyde-forming)
MAKQLPEHAQVVIIGGGIVGCSVAYHLTKLNWQDVVLLERKALTSGTTWAAAGLVGQLWATSSLTKLAQYGTELYTRLEQETGQHTGFVKCGSLRVAQTKERKCEYDRSMAMARAFGIEMEEISFEEARRMWPFLYTDDLEAVYYQPNDAKTNPVDTAQALARGARMGGAKIFEDVKVTDIHLKKGAVCAVNTDRGMINCEIVVNCGGMWAREIGKLVGVGVPLQAAEHMHIVTTPIEGMPKDLPVLRDMDGYIYFREETGGLLMGGFEPVAKPWGMKGIPEQFAFTELNEDWDQFQIFMDNAIKRCPVLETAQVRHLTVVPESFTPDNAYMLGEAPGVKKFFVAAGMNSVGIASAAGSGKALAQWIDQGYPEEDLWSVDIRRFYGWQANARYLYDRTTEAVGLLYADHWPFNQRKTARNVRRTPFHDRLAQRGACFGEVAGWERANWFAPRGVKAEYVYSWGRQNWFEYSAAEHMAVRENVGVYDLSSMAKFLVQGHDSLAELQRICGNNLDVPEGKVVYTQFLNQRGGIEADVTVTRLSENRYFIVTPGATGTRDFDWIRRHLREEAHAFVTDVTSAYTMLAVMGPRARDLLSTLTDADLSNEAFPFATAQQIDVAYARPIVMRMSFVGELGWELYIPTEFSNNVFDALMREGEKFDLKMVGLHALDSLRLEKGYRHWGADITPDDTPFEAGLGFCVKLDKGDFVGKDALVKQTETGLTRKLVIFTLEDPEPLLYHDEPILRNGVKVSENTHGAYAHFLGSAIGMGYLENPDGNDDEWILSGKYQIDVEGKLIAARVHLKAPYDPESKRVRM